MTKRCHWTTEVRISEVGPLGTVWPQRILEWLQEAAVLGSTQAGFPPKWYEVEGSSWFLREVRLEILRAPAYEEPVDIETWISGMRRFKAHRQYIGRVKDEPVIRAQADWMFLARQPDGGVRPRHPDEAMKRAFFVAEEQAISSSVPAWGASLEPGQGHRHSRTVHPSEMDRHGHVNHVHYMGWLEDHAHTVLKDEAGTLRWARIQYVAQARTGDVVEVASFRTGDRWVQEVHRGTERLIRAVTMRGPAGPAAW